MSMGRRYSLLPFLLALLGGADGARASERVMLANGYSINCHHHEEEQEGRVRLYIDRSEDSYIEVAASSIISVEPVTVQPPAEAGKQAPAAQIAAKPKPELLSEAEVRTLLAEAGQQHDLDVDLLASVVQAESAGKQNAVSRAGARGLMQLMPATAKGMGVENLEEPSENLHGGSRYLDALLKRYHENLALALAAYNAGPTAVDRYHGIPPYPETKAYVARVIREFNRRVAERRALGKHKPAGRP